MERTYINMCFNIGFDIGFFFNRCDIHKIGHFPILYVHKFIYTCIHVLRYMYSGEKKYLVSH